MICPFMLAHTCKGECKEAECAMWRTDHCGLAGELKVAKKYAKNDKRVMLGKFVKLTTGEHQELNTEFGYKETQEMIDKMELYINRTGKSYKDYNLALRQWFKNEMERKVQEQQPRVVY